MTLLSRRKHPTTPPSSPRATEHRLTSRRQLVAGVLASLALFGGPALLVARDIEPTPTIKATPSAALKWAPHRGGTVKPAAGSSTQSKRSSAMPSASATKQALSSNLRWKPYREARRQSTVSPTTETASTTEATTKLADDSSAARAAAHRRQESQHVVQTSGTKPRNNAFDDPFFSEQAAQTSKPEPIVLPALEPTPADPFHGSERVARRQPSSGRSTELQPGVDPLDLSPQDEAVDRAAEDMPEPDQPLEQPESDAPAETTLPDEGLNEPTPAQPGQPELTAPDMREEPDTGAIEDSFREPSQPDEGDTAWEQEMAQLREGQQPPACRKPEEILKRIRDITSDISADAGDFPPECPLGDSPFEPRMWHLTAFHWKASGLCHKPLYFEQVGVERYGHSLGPILQPMWSGVDFYGRIFLLPYEMGIEPPWECVYALGYYRPGSCAPKMIFPFPVSIRGGLLEAGAVLGAVYLLP
ncbi:MAG: hypothetical protein K2Y37_15890 [Pirellulales bacterium]|nr:hypothetical protein [Pirellulales bacterium]